MGIQTCAHVPLRASFHSFFDSKDVGAVCPQIPHPSPTPLGFHQNEYFLLSTLHVCGKLSLCDTVSYIFICLLSFWFIPTDMFREQNVIFPSSVCLGAGSESEMKYISIIYCIYV